MKKSILTTTAIAALIAAGPAIAQTAPTAPASPSSAPGTPECAGTVNNCSLIDQDGTDLTADVTQSGSGNTSDIDQNNGSIEAEAKVTQSGTGGSSYILQSNSGIAGFPTRATVNQSGQGSDSTILQTDTRNHSALVTQVGDSTSFIAQNGGLDTSAEVLQNGGSDNNAVVFQEAGNKASVGDSNPNNTRSGIIQTGSLNNAEIYQGNFAAPTPTGATGTKATTTQTGIDNDSIVIQNVTGPNQGGTGSQDVNVTQTGDLNQSSVVQTGIRDAQKVDVLQSGNDNLSRVNQSDPSGTNPGAGNIVDVKQFGDESDSFIDQTSSTGTARVTQTTTSLHGSRPRADQPDYLGEDASVRANYSRIVQNGTGITDATVTQDGTLNRSDIAQSAASGTATAIVDQDGIFNNSAVQQTAAATADVMQGGAYGDNNSFVDQSADGANALVVQNGDESVGGPGFPTNESFITQGASASADVEQNGSQNFSDVDQLAGSDNATATVRQTTSPLAIGSGDARNESVINQTAMTSAYVEQIGQSNDSNVQQFGASVAAGSATLADARAAADVRQFGFNGESDIFQGLGTGNQALLTQTAMSTNAESFIDQDGDDNTAEVTQGGDGNYSSVVQTGNGNAATVNQTLTSGSSSFVTQGGIGNTANVNQ